MIDMLAKEAVDYIAEGYLIRDAIDMAIANHVMTSAYPAWLYGRVESKVLLGR